MLYRLVACWLLQFLLCHFMGLVPGGTFLPCLSGGGYTVQLSITLGMVRFRTRFAYTKYIRHSQKNLAHEFSSLICMEILHHAISRDPFFNKFPDDCLSFMIWNGVSFHFVK